MNNKKINDGCNYLNFKCTYNNVKQIISRENNGASYSTYNTIRAKTNGSSNTTSKKNN
ncbi:hypothetical protein [Campylobacter sp. MG1]|uniref:hypothetical protein n=1 Tax=Campylobacter sp. MG1 TaxID=2976332 RepID=UPI00226CD052|nr:hypothetical protein [Campylobacter sp. MG1]